MRRSEPKEMVFIQADLGVLGESIWGASLLQAQTNLHGCDEFEMCTDVSRIQVC
jgi:hypothetical protein